ncbi:MAG: transcription-repair coupling factor [Deltaproteobacteria bacterium]|nr:transcription-repair coupling factor [Deltaproteobacteria bacterium]
MSFLQDAENLLDRGLGWAGLAGDALAFVLSQVAVERRWLVVVDEADRAARLVAGLRFFHPEPARVLGFPADDARPYDGFSPDAAIPRERIRTLHLALAGGPVVVVAPVAALMQRIPDRATRARGTRVVERGEVLDRDVLVRWLVEAGYLATGRVQESGTFAVRGDVLDVWGTGHRRPARLDFFDDEVEDLRRFEPTTQRTTRRLGALPLLPAREERLDPMALERAGAELARLALEQKRGRTLRRRVFEEWKAGIRFSAIEDWLPALVPTETPLEALRDLKLVVVHPDEVAASARELERSARQRWEVLEEDEQPLVPPQERYIGAVPILEQLSAGHPVHEFAREGESVDLGTRPTHGFAVKGADLGPVVRRLRDMAEAGLRVGLVVEEGKRAERLLEMLSSRGLDHRLLGSPWEIAPEEVAVVYGHLTQGFVAESSGWAFIAADTLFGARRPRTSQMHALFEVAVSSLSQLKEGDHVVHRLHGIGIYRGLHRLPVHGVEQDFVRLEYRGGDRMYLPVTALAQLSRYRPSRQGVSVRLDRLGGVTWAKRRQRVRDSILAIANELLGIYARRELAARPPCADPGPMYRAFEARFPWEETPDQAAAIDAVNDDLSREVPSDRLLCGDVGFGKTEVAMRAAVRLVEAGRQVAVLCPTTVLAFQHLQTFRDRFDGLPVRIAMLSRFLSGPEEKEVLDEMRTGEVDIVVGTTRLLGRQVRWRDLGLLVVDEEHRFGVRQKEKMKKLRAGIDVLSMSATPIPRTLEMALSGLRDMSVMATPPQDRLSVRTSVARLRRTRVRDAVLHEVERTGQVFFIHNRVETIERMAEQLREWIPEVSLAVAHGQLENAALEEVLVAFIRREIDVLVSSAIVESGVDLPNVNTMIINRADRFGLAQLYQLRGRVGRSSVRGNCLLLIPEQMSREAGRRLRVLTENTQLGAGFQIAAADLEMRGGGNLLGEAQSGNIDAVGYDMWVELLEEAVRHARGDLALQRLEPEVEVAVPAFIPETYLRDMGERLTWYRRLSTAADAAEIDRLLDEMEDLEGEAPVEVHNLAGLLQARAECRELGVVRCSFLKVRVVLEFHEHSPVARGQVVELVREHPKRFSVVEKEGEPMLMEVRVLPTEAERPFHFLRWVMANIRK